MMRHVVASVAFTLGLCSSAMAADFETADALFAKRDQGREATQQARAAYQAIVDQGAKDQDLIRATVGIARTYLYEGSALLDVNDPEQKKQRKQVFSDCWQKTVESISPKNLGVSIPAYWYLRASCLAQEAEVSSVLERLANLPKLNEAFEKGLALQDGDNFEGGGIKRVKAAVKGNPEAKGLPGGLFNPAEALKIIDEAIEAPATTSPGVSTPEGFLYCENYRRKIMTLNVLERGSEAKALAAETVTNFNEYLAADILPEILRAETVYCIDQVQKLM